MEKGNIIIQRTPIDSVRDLTGFQRDLLHVLAGLDEPKGLAVKHELDKYYCSEINHGRLYSNLDSLVEKGLVEKGQIDDWTNSHALTGRGRRELEARRKWETASVGESADA